VAKQSADSLHGKYMVNSKRWLRVEGWMLAGGQSHLNHRQFAVSYTRSITKSGRNLHGHSWLHPFFVQAAFSQTGMITLWALSILFIRDEVCSSGHDLMWLCQQNVPQQEWPH